MAVPPVADFTARDALPFLFYPLLAACWSFVYRLPRSYLSRHRSEFFAELQLISNDERESFFGKAAITHGQFHGWTAILVALGIVVYFGGGPILAFELDADPGMIKALLLAAILLASPFVYLFSLRSQISIALRTALNERGEPVCMKCGYSLKGTPEAICNECGEPHHLDTCWTCLGRGSISRVQHFLMGIAFSGGWGLLIGLLWWLWRDAGKVIIVAVATCPAAIIGINILAWYFIGGRNKPCPKCGGSGVWEPSALASTQHA